MQTISMSGLSSQGNHRHLHQKQRVRLALCTSTAGVGFCVGGPSDNIRSEVGVGIAILRLEVRSCFEELLWCYAYTGWGEKKHGRVIVVLGGKGRVVGAASARRWLFRALPCEFCTMVTITVKEGE